MNLDERRAGIFQESWLAGETAADEMVRRAGDEFECSRRIVSVCCSLVLAIDKVARQRVRAEVSERLRVELHLAARCWEIAISKGRQSHIHRNGALAFQTFQS